MIRDEPTPSLDDLPDVWDGPEPADPEPDVPPGAAVDRDRSDVRLGDIYSDVSADVSADVPTDDPSSSTGAILGTASAPRDHAPSPRRATDRVQPFGEVLAGHVLVPAATIAMVSSLFFYLYDVRSVFLPGARQLKWLGFWFVVATVLIARFGKQSGDHDRRRLYTGALALATIFVMIQSPWEAPEAGVLGAMANSAIVLLVWRYASALTRRLSADLDRAPKRHPTIYGLARLEMERLGTERDRSAAPASVYAIGRRARAASSTALSADPRKARRDIVLLILAGLGLFALGEPFLLTGPPAAGQRALGAMLVFLLAAGCVLAAAAAHRASRRAWRLGTPTPTASVAGRVVATAAALVLVLVVALGMPGLDVRGTGERVPVAPPSDGPRSESSDAESSDGESSDAESSDPESSEARRADDPSPNEPSQSRSTEPARSASAIVEAAASLGDWIRWPLIAAALLALAWLAWRYAHVVAHGLHALGRWLRRLGAAFRWPGWPGWRTRSADSEASTTIGDPLADLGALDHAPPREAVLEAYARLRAALAALGSPPPPDTTPLELVARWPLVWHPAKPAARRLTELAQRAAWASDLTDLDAASRRDAVAALEEVRSVRDQASARRQSTRRNS